MENLIANGCAIDSNSDAITDGPTTRPIASLLRCRQSQ
jgi:hypothetical protein